ncbi:MAG TPA: GAF domain-containing protein [Candidatus Elarobacter sp.]|nr:GAF domain-containing protein [Candidatus Elarobacter sp.]
MMRNALLAFANRVHFIEDRATVVERTVEEIRRATGAAWVAAYTPVDEGCVTLAAMAGDIAFGAPDEIDQDDPALVELRAERSLLDGPADSVLAGALLLPFVVAGRITGLLVVAPPADRFSSAERELLGSVARAVGLAFEVLAVRALRREATYWRGRAESAQRELEAVRGRRTPPTPMRVGADLL